MRRFAQTFFSYNLKSSVTCLFCIPFSCSHAEWPSLLPVVPRTVYNPKRYDPLFEAHRHIRIQPWDTMLNLFRLSLRLVWPALIIESLVYYETQIPVFGSLVSFFGYTDSKTERR
jgi:hypothetical protein